ncbi:hypothetical protein RJ639_007204 [Escallonia herrerae]|uniref:Uncharacterized protein n=1 Tax=Escallonia herrerae TaxID=1293975 RepID=A0AA88W0B0_9ASTE|nr:hypothetical protein RJ639_007204 [Escallonia herrerae]
MVTSIIPTVDLSHFFTDGDEDGKKKAMEIISLACSEFGFFQVVNHGVPLSLMSRAMELSKIFFAYPTEEKRKSAPKPGAPLPAGYNDWDARKEDAFICPPGTSFNVFPSNPPESQYDDVGGLEVRKDSEWIPVNPAKGALVVNVGDVIQVLSNNSVNRDKWIEPLSQLTREIGEPAKYRGFTHRDYGVLRMRQRTNPSRPEEKFDITHYAILT